MARPMLRIGFETKIPAVERAKTVHALYRATAVFGSVVIRNLLYCQLIECHFISKRIIVDTADMKSFQTSLVVAG
jgi:hypothetical protein